ncbi:hypothetical protein EFN19_12430, partial [Propionibacterium freudenreichii]|nr:hypothetical protein [Propionibacterium freudenreichii]MCT3003680.1 hypothetical protein [Propionibacterium freudenreichii]
VSGAFVVVGDHGAHGTQIDQGDMPIRVRRSRRKLSRQQQEREPAEIFPKKMVPTLDMLEHCCYACVTRTKQEAPPGSTPMRPRP